MIWVCGDIHGKLDISKLNSDHFKYGKYLTRDDYVIILGDFGLVWAQDETPEEDYWLNWLNDKPWTTLFIDGNHENFDRLSTYYTTTWHGGKAQFIRENVIHLCRGQIFYLNGKSVFTFGGARSHDIEDGILEYPQDEAKIKKWYKDSTKYFRVNHYSWWKEELPSKAEIAEADMNLKKVDYEVDYILTHSPNSKDSRIMGYAEIDWFEEYLTEIEDNVKYGAWYFGHLHKDRQVRENHMCVYNDVIPIYVEF